MMVGIAAPVSAQSTGARDLQLVGANALISGLTAGLSSLTRGRDFSPAFISGFVGGGLSYVGKMVSAADFTASGLLGRQLGAVGASAVRSAAFGNASLDTLFLPIGPFRLHVNTANPRESKASLDVEETAWLVHALSVDAFRFDPRESLSSGSFVFVGKDGSWSDSDPALGRTRPGTIKIRRGANRDRSVLIHERTHILQFDYLKIVGGLPIEGRIRRMLGEPDTSFLRHIRLGAGHYPIISLIGAPWFNRAHNIFEIEAEYFERW